MVASRFASLCAVFALRA